VVALLKLKADVEFCDEQGLTALHHAVLSGHGDVVHVLLEHGADINARATKMGSPLCLAALNGDLRMVQILLGARAKVELSDGPFGTALHCACYNGNLAIARALVQKGALIDSKCPLDFEQLRRYCCPSRSGASTTSGETASTLTETWSPLFLVVWRGFSDVLQLLLAAGCQVNSPCGVDLALADSGGNTLLRFAMQKENSEIAQILADEAAKRRGSWRSRLFLSTFDATAKEVFECIVSASEANSPQRMDPIQIAAKRSLANAIPVLHSLGAHATHTDGQAWTAAHHAAQSGSLDAFRFVLELGAVLDAPTNQRETALAIASRAGHSEIVLDALQRGADPDVRNSLGLTPLHLAAGSGHVKTAGVLISNTVNPSAKSIAGDSALHYASRGGHSLLFPVLLGRGLDPNLPNNAGRTALDDALDEKTRAALLACYQSRLLPAQATQAPAVRVAPVPPPVTALAMKPQNSAPAPIVHEKSKPNLAESLASLFAYIVLFIVFLVALPAVLVACVQILGTIAAIGTFWAVMPTPSTVDGGSLLGTLLAVFEGFWKMLIIFCSLALAMGIGKASNAPGIATIGMLCAFPWLGLHWWAAATGSMALGHAYLISGLICGSIYLALGALIRRQEVARIRATAKT
jgi:ankyrin repeat protein